MSISCFGIDHLLFVLGLLLVVKSVGRVVATVTAFTVAHSITLAAATLGLVRVPGPPVKRVIALSIVFVAARNRARRTGQAGPDGALAVAGGLHLRIAARIRLRAARSANRPAANAIPLALFFFNLGVELGQLLFVAAFAIAALVDGPGPHRLAALDRTGAGLRDRQHCNVLGVSASLRWATAHSVFVPECS